MNMCLNLSMKYGDKNDVMINKFRNMFNYSTINNLLCNFG